LRWRDIRNSGIDLNNPVYIFSKQTNSVQTGNTTSGGLIAQITDDKKLEAFLKKEKPGGDILSGGKYKYLSLGNDFIAGWTDKILIISLVTGGSSAPGTYSTGEGTLSQLQLTTLFTQEESASIASIGEFRDILAKPGDVHFYTNAAANFSASPMLGMTKANELLEGSYTEGIINFENGKIDASAETHTSKALSDILGKYPSKEIDKGMITNYPDTLSGFGIVSFDPKILIDVVHYLGVDAMADGFISQAGFTTSDVLNAFSGDIAVIFSNPKKPSLSNMPGTEFLLNMRIGDKTAFNKVLTGLMDKHFLSKNGNEYHLGLFGEHDFIIEITDDNLFVASDDALVNAYQSSNTKISLQPDVEKELSNKSMAMYVDIAELLKNSKKDSSSDIHLNNTHFAFSNTARSAKATFKNFIATTDKSDSKVINGHFELNFVNDNENSLASLTKLISIAHEEEMKRKKNSLSKNDSDN